MSPDELNQEYKYQARPEDDIDAPHPQGEHPPERGKDPEMGPGKGRWEKMVLKQKVAEKKNRTHRNHKGHEPHQKKLGKGGAHQFEEHVGGGSLARARRSSSV